MFAESLLVVSLFLIIYNYFMYPALIFILASLARNKNKTDKFKSEYFPTVSIVIAAYNEENVIAAKLDNTLQLDYPKKLLQIIVVSDGSDDSTPEIAESYENQGIISLFQTPREGKSAAINRSLKHVSGEVIIFSDSNNDFSSNAIRELVKHFSDPSIAAVTGAKHIYSNENRKSATGDGLYWKYESNIKKSESTLGSITAAEGEILAVRSELMNPLNPEDINDDAAITFDLVKRGYRVLYEEKAVSLEQASRDLKDDFNVKVRMTAGGFQTIATEFSFLFPPRSWFAISFFFTQNTTLVNPSAIDYRFYI